MQDSMGHEGRSLGEDTSGAVETDRSGPVRDPGRADELLEVPADDADVGSTNCRVGDPGESWTCFEHTVCPHRKVVGASSSSVQ